MNENKLDAIIQRIRENEAETFSQFSLKKYNLTKRPSPLPILVGSTHPFVLIAEVKKASPSRGLIREAFDPVKLARAYQRAGASAISVITEEHFFQGAKDHLVSVRKNISLPLLRKDFIIHPSQVVESYNSGADMIILIAACLSDEEMKR